jgi:hypothetical protein
MFWGHQYRADQVPLLSLRPLLHVLHGLVDAGNTGIVIEHDVDVITQAGPVIDLGPEGAREGGEGVFTGAFLNWGRSGWAIWGMAPDNVGIWLARP